MKLTGECLKGFEEWYKKVYLKRFPFFIRPFALILFYIDTPSEQWGVVEEYADSLNCYISVWGIIEDVINMKAGYDATVSYKGELHFLSGDEFFNTRQEARNAAVEKFDELVNNALNKEG